MKMKLLRSKMNFLLLLLINVVNGLYYSAPNGLAEKNKPPSLEHDGGNALGQQSQYSAPELFNAEDAEERMLLKNLLLADGRKGLFLANDNNIAFTNGKPLDR